MFGKTEYKLTCERCNHVWYVTSGEIRKARRARRHIASMKLQSYGLHTLKTYNKINTSLAIMSSAAIEPFMCPACYSQRVTKTRA